MANENKLQSSPAFEEYSEEPKKSKIARKIKESPFMIAGWMGLCGVVGYGAYSLKNRKIPLSVHLIHMRVRAQGFVVGCLTVGVAYKMFNEYVYPKLVHEYEDFKSKNISK